MKFERIKPGMVLYDLHKERAGNTRLRRWGLWPVYIVSVDTEKRTARVHWNVKWNPEQTYTERQLKRLREHEPVMVKTGVLGFRRPETSAEKKARLAASEHADGTGD